MMGSSRMAVTDVSFVLYDESKRLRMPHVKGSFNDWNLAPMEKGEDGIWTYSQPISAGTYEWGMVEPDGSEWGIWLPENAGHKVNLVVTVSRAGQVEGATSIRIPSKPLGRRNGIEPFLDLSVRDRKGVDDLLKLLSKASMLNVLHVIISAREPVRFGKIQRLAGTSATSLSRRLKELEGCGLVRRATHKTIPPTVEYQATQVAFEMGPSLIQLYNWVIDNHAKLGFTQA
ncbi:MAG: winged helix-turn-helix transcriptional regulator, partial [Candidatus Thermoplasmatota archaeon]|nr:winged helix-turn-helix transcriptional regulator [Candidatus Thermoplasmatota archaeon]